MKCGFLEAGILLTVGCILLLARPALAEVRTITTTGEYRMGDNDTRTDAKRLALLDAKRLALEQAGVYIESITEVKNLDLAKDEIRAYTAGIVEVIEQASRTMMEGETTVIRVDVKVKIDTDVVARQIEALRKNEDVRAKLLRAETEALKLRKEVDAKTHELAVAKTKAVAETVTKERQRILTQADVESLIARARVVLAGPKGFTVTVGTSTPESRKYARGLIEQALSYDPENTEAQGLLGFVQFEEGQREEAISTFRDIAKKEPLSAHAHKNLGVMLQSSGDWWGAKQEYETALKLAPDFAEAHACLGRTLQMMAVLRVDPDQRMEEVIRELEERRFQRRLSHEETAKLDKIQKDRRKELSETWSAWRERAIDEFRKAVRLAPRNATYHRELGQALSLFAYSHRQLVRGINEEEDQRILADAQRDREEGLTELRNAIALDPSDAAAHRALAQELGVGEEAIAEYRAAIHFDPTDSYSRIELGKLLLVRTEKDVPGAMREFQAAVRIDPKNPQAHVRLGYAFEDELGQMDKAIEEYRKSVDLGSDGLNPPLHFRVGLLSHALAKIGKRKEAAKVIRDHLKSEPEEEAFFHEHLLELERE